ncbi:DEAD/DEAH box helicase [Allokutzneria oryzae]|uniref:DNA 3'-5' helicase n=1 Tax=Allokutzneria oryzae TaxID=1378989 RepID=A0ABV5ZXA1_9PSEU
MERVSREDPMHHLPKRLQRVVELVGEFESGLTRAQLGDLARQRGLLLHQRLVEKLVLDACAAGVLTETDGVLSLLARAGGDSPDGHNADKRERGDQRTQTARAVVIDLEAVVRTTTVEPYTDRRVFQIGAVRIGTDPDWVAAQPTFGRFLALPDEAWEIRSQEVRRRHAREAIEPVAALRELRDYCADADLMVSYNGHESDLPLLTAAYQREELQAPDLAHVDALYLAHALWPRASTHRLAPLAALVGVDCEGLNWHDAVDDAVLLARLLHCGAEKVRQWPSGIRDLVASVCPDSDAWGLLRRLAAAGGPDGVMLGESRPHGHADVADVLAANLGTHTLRRTAHGPRTHRSGLVVGDELRGADRRVDPAALATAARGVPADRRAAQERMATELHELAQAGTPALIEAPTGTGKSFAILAAALDWLAGAPQRTAIITTFTKQLQAQLAKDVARLDGAIPGLLASCDVVKGQTNRLSLRSLTMTLADATAAPSAHGHPRAGSGGRFLARPAFRELAVFLLLRLIETDNIPSSWRARSVDPVDLPPFFLTYSDPALPVWLDSLSQASNGEYPAKASAAIADHTDSVREALSSHRLLLANHALLLAHLDDLGSLGGDTLLVIDEAHQIEDAATSALTTTVDYRAVENLVEELGIWCENAQRSPASDAVAKALKDVRSLLEHEQLPRIAGMAFDSKGTGAGVVVGSRTVTLASSYSGSAGAAQVRQLSSLLRRLGGHCNSVSRALGGYIASHESVLDFFEHERATALRARCTEVSESAGSIVADIENTVGPVPVHDVVAPEEVADSGVEDQDDVEDDGPSLELHYRTDADDGESDEETDELDDDPIASMSMAALPDTSNRVVYAEELGVLSAGLRRYRFRIASSPVELFADATWQRFLITFARTYYVSATLRVAGRWQFIKDRLGLPAGIRALELETPFDLDKQAELICLSDFPSWAEQSEGAMRTVAHQLAGYSHEVIREVSFDDDAEGRRGGFDGGALVLTTARSTAGGIADHLATALRRRGDQTTVLSALVLGNPRAVDQFTDNEHGGGILVGTKGLWQGVDVADHRRLRLVWINKLPFAPFAAPVIETRRAAVAARAEAARADDPEAVATETYYLPLAALQLRQAVGRLVRSKEHRGVVVISDRKLAGQATLRRMYRRTFLESLDGGLLRADPITGEPAGGNVVTMAEGWSRIWAFLAAEGVLSEERAAELSSPEALEEQTLLPETREIRRLELTADEVRRHRDVGTLEEVVLSRAAKIGGLLRLSQEPAELKPAQRGVIAAVARGQNVLGLLPTGFGKSFCFQLPALVLPGVTVVVSPLIALMHDQALELNRSIGGAVRALVAPLRESNSRAGKTEVAEQLLGRADHGIRMVYVSPERLCQRRFRELVRGAVENGIVTRIVLDEAHTFVQWDDFRPAVSRVEHFLAELRRDFDLPVTALTATANRTVCSGLRSGVFGVEPEAPGGASGEMVEAAAGVLHTVRENPLRPELAIHRRSIGNAGPSISAGLAEVVLDAVSDHAIFYCLTVKEVVALHAHLRDYLGDGGVRVRRFHGRLTEVEKSSVMTEFREAPRKDDEGFVPLVIVATSAFGLGVNRPDVRTVFCVSAPTDLAALYQQIGRAGRDGARATTSAGTSAPVNVGLALMTNRGLRTIRFMTTSSIPETLLERMGRAVLACDGVLDAVAVADGLIGEDLKSGLLSADEARRSRTSEKYQSTVMRAFAVLSERSLVADLGDFPPLCTVKAGELHGVGIQRGPADAAGTEDAVVAAVLALPVRAERANGLRRERLDVVRLDNQLAKVVPEYRTLCEDAAGTWQLLADLHDRGLLDVSAAPSRRLVTGVRVDDIELPHDFVDHMLAKAYRVAQEVHLLEEFFKNQQMCANQSLADYFGVDLPERCCSHAGNRCSACWNAGGWPIEENMPGILDSFLAPKPRPAGAGGDSVQRKRLLDKQVSQLVWLMFNGVRASELYRALRGEDSYFNPYTRRRVPIRTKLTTSRYFGANPAVRAEEIDSSLARLADAGRVIADGKRWRDAASAGQQTALAVRASTPGQPRRSNGEETA